MIRDLTADEVALIDEALTRGMTSTERERKLADDLREKLGVARVHGPGDRIVPEGDPLADDPAVVVLDAAGEILGTFDPDRVRVRFPARPPLVRLLGDLGGGIFRSAGPASIEIRSNGAGVEVRQPEGATLAVELHSSNLVRVRLVDDERGDGEVVIGA